MDTTRVVRKSTAIAVLQYAEIGVAGVFPPRKIHADNGSRGRRGHTDDEIGPLLLRVNQLHSAVNLQQNIFKMLTRRKYVYVIYRVIL